MTITDYFKAETEVYIQNTSKPLGVVSFTLGEREETHFTVPKTTVPLILTEFVPKDKVEKSVSLRSLVQKGLIRLLTVTEYAEVMAQFDAAKAIQAEASVVQLQEKKPEVALEVADNKPQDEKMPQINSRVLQLVNMLNLPKGSDIEGAVPSVDAIIDELTTLSLVEDDLVYLSSNTKGKVRKWVSTQLESLYNSRGQ